VAAKSGKFTAGETGKGQFLLISLRSLAKERIVRKISSRGRVANFLIFAVANCYILLLTCIVLNETIYRKF